MMVRATACPRLPAEFSKVRFSAVKSLAWMKTVCVAKVLMGPFGPGRPVWELLVMTVVPGSSPRKVRKGLGIIVGSPDRNPVREGKDLFNAAFFLYDRQIIGIAHKTCLPNYDVFDEYRYFEPAFDWNIIRFKGKRIALTICEDIWNLGDNPLYRICPMDILMEQQPDFMVNISASPFDYTHIEARKATIKSNVLKYKIPLLYCNAVGSQTEIVFDGASLVFDKDANLCY